MKTDPSEPITEPVQALRCGDLYDDCQDTPQTIQTHISHLFLTDSHVYKLKKPVDFGFLDYSTLEKRRSACHSELEINRRLAPDVYLDVTHVGRDAIGNWKIGGDAEPEDWLVKMKRLPDHRCLAEIIEAKRWGESDAQQIITTLASFYQSLDPVQCSTYYDDCLKHVRENQSELKNPDHDLPAELVQRIHAAQRQFHFLHRDLFEDRVAGGHVVEGHGDLRAEHIYMTEPPVVIDGIEFSRQLRTVDIADELSFFAITCEILNAPKLGRQVLRGVCQTLGDAPDIRLLDFYHSYRACVRAKVQALRTDQVVGNAETRAHHRAETYLEIADRYASQLAPPIAVIVRGLSGTGKTTLARKIAKRMGAAHLSTDRIRRQLAKADDRGDEAEISYSEQARQAIYRTMIDRAIDHLDQRASVVLDGTFLTRQRMLDFTDSIDDTQVALAIITCTCPEQVAIERMIARQSKRESDSDADQTVYRQQLDQIEAVPESFANHDLATNQDQTQQMAEIQNFLATLMRHRKETT
ncbi:nucleoside monophosphate kinase [Stieleria sp. TO1_6]|uniref:bifunctional aminoglycoside phosphotransferase/ATP-binding protein n=1 Tax=Stieleria tagensis TaxID=2956795 RepID=UPI00209AEA3F|nr:nucleoside monophosphate kinase [Stieleria tagensis]MCO8122651.1 nucleoside monophosphate kinase [Stieleria tagensis]